MPRKFLTPGTLVQKVKRNSELRLRVVLPARTTKGEWIMPFLIPVLVGVPLLFGGGYVIYHVFH